MSRNYLLGILLLGCCFFVNAQSIYEDPDLGYSIYLPQNWVKSTYTDSHHIFYDQTGEYGAYLSLVRSSITDTVYKEPKDWARANAIAYKLYLEYNWCDSADCYPYGVVIDFDTTDVRKQRTSSGDSVWTCDMYMRFYSFDTVMYAWDEYVRFAAVGNAGYEMYAIGDTLDMSSRIGLYAAVLSTIELEDTPSNVTNRMPGNLELRRFGATGTGSPGMRAYDAAGRMRSSVLRKSMERRAAAGVYLREAQKIISVSE